MWPCHSPLVLLCQLALYLSLLSVCGCVFTLASLLLDQHTWKQSGDNSPVCKPVITHLLLTAEDSFQLMPDCCISSGSVAQACFGTAWFSLRADASCLLSFCSAKFVEKKEPEKKNKLSGSYLPAPFVYTTWKKDKAFLSFCFIDCSDLHIYNKPITILLWRPAFEYRSGLFFDRYRNFRFLFPHSWLHKTA